MKITAELLRDLIKDVDLYRAHKTADASRYESLVEHTQLTAKNFHYIYQQKHIDTMLDRFQAHLLPNLSVQAVDFWHGLIDAILVFHDIGKINPKFQSGKMDNAQIRDDFDFRIGSAHSLISAVLYVDYFKKQLRNSGLSKEDKHALNPFILLHSYIIARHHSDMVDLSTYLNILSDNPDDSLIDRRKELQDVIVKLHDCQAGIYLPKFNTSYDQIGGRAKNLRNYLESLSDENSIYMYIYEKTLFSLLLAADYYATAEFMSGFDAVKTGRIEDIAHWTDIYEKTAVMQSVRAFQREKFPLSDDALAKTENINELRCEIFCSAEKQLKSSSSQNIFYLEAPTGSGKSNTAVNLTFQLMKSDDKLQKTYYIYPFNTLVEQNLTSLSKIFGGDDKIMNDIAVVNSLTAIKCDETYYDAVYKWQKALLDRQFLNYPLILSTHVSLFNTMFGSSRESAFGFHQLAGSVIVLDEIQSYKNKLWSEIIYFLKGMAELLHMKVIIMSATLPNLDFLAQDTKAAAVLLPDAQRYFSHRLFKQRVQISYELMQKTYTDTDELLADLLEHLKQDISDGKKVMLEFITKKTAYDVWQKLKESETNLACDIEYMSGDDSLAERARILKKVSNAPSGIVLVATQVIEAGVDIDMDIGYKNISKLDSEEQFMGRINRSCLREGRVYFFKLDNYRQVYKGDVRTNPELTLENGAMRSVLAQKDYTSYYEKVMQRLKDNLYEGYGSDSLDAFFKLLKSLDWQTIAGRMKLIDDDKQSMQVYLAREITDDAGNTIDGHKVWQHYTELLRDNTMDYAEKRIRLSEVKAQMNNFIYEIKYNPMLVYDEKYGEIYYIADGSKYFDEDKLNRAKIQGEVGDFVDFI